MVSSIWVLLATTWLASSMLVGAEDTIFNGEKLLTDQFIENGPYKFIMQGDCNLVLYNKDRALWHTNTAGHGNSCNLLMQNNGNLVIFSGSDVIWSSSTSRGPNTYRLVVQLDGYVVIYGGATWATNTVQKSTKRKLIIEPLM
ncbi:mannose-specific lectin-like [Magnolia sinica]|uniref:mannose-specific lectin-like n=1 Tax=Magnolia sinica TaxID=86752 RepID=UPI002658D80F|nr:mannose-specific lectin-like [Magnolia sinica]